MMQHGEIGDIRGSGLFVGLELVKRDGTPDPVLLSELQKACFSDGLILWKGDRAANVARVMPALVITEHMLQRGLSVLGNRLPRPT